MEQLARALVQSVARHMTFRDVEAVADAFFFPHPVYFDNDMRIVATRAQFVAMTREYLDRLTANGIATVEATDVDVVSRSDDRCCLTVFWVYRGADGEVLGSTFNELFFSGDERGVRISQISIHASTNGTLREYYGKKDTIFDA